MWLVTWVVTVLLIGALGGMLGALAERSAKPGVTPLSEFVSAFFAGRAKDSPFRFGRRLGSRS